ncbi:hypothetical protein COV11_04765 [Candidatus Woesearchaeota archaeon CG10_big_fil_rev_8_21_14_0_10_30_7]|nr:MAG: hypothetical protein COV11_04765 [Candidatus Woesearchaeota archaeon CG10_big_fil_rev_8_21_14_0_10_30_7]
MVVKEELLSKLRRYFALNLYEVKIWTGLLSRGVATAGELSDIANVPRSRSYDVLESLERKGFVVLKLGKPIKYLAVPPQEVLERVKKNMLEEAEERTKRLEKLKKTDLIQELNSLHNTGIKLLEPNEMMGSLKGRNNLHAHLERSVRDAQKTVTLMTTADGLMRKVDKLKPVFEKLSKKGVRIRIAAPITKDSKKLASTLGKTAEVRHTDAKARFCVVDGKELVFSMADDKEVHPTYDFAVWANTPFFAQALEDMFNQSWKSMKPVK